MPHYFFDVDDGGWVTRDETGLSFGSRQELRDEVVRALGGMAQDLRLDGNERELSIRVRDESGKYVLAGRAALSAEWL